MSAWVRFATRLHRRIVRRLPQEFRMRHGEDLELAGDDAAPLLWERYGIFGLLRMLAAAAVGLVVEYCSETGRDVGYALRRLRSSPGFTAIGVLSLAMALGMSSLFFNQMSAMNAGAPGIEDPDSLVATGGRVSYPYFERYREQREVVSEAAAFIGPTPFSVSVGDEGTERERIFGHLVTPEYFRTLGVKPAAGRLFDPNKEKPGSGVPVIVSYLFWETRLNSDPSAVGELIRINGHWATIVGITQQGFRGVFPLNPAELYLPTSVGPAVAPELRNQDWRSTDDRSFRALFRLADGVSMQEAAAALQVTTKLLDEQRPEEERPREERTLELLQAGIVGPASEEQRKATYGVNLTLIGMLVALACSNLAVLLLARGGERRKEVAIRLSVGASKFRAVRQVLTESVILGVLGGTAGLLFSHWILRLQGTLEFPSNVPFEVPLQLEWSTALFALAISVAAGFGFGLVPALAIVRGDLAPALKEGSQPKLRSYGRFGIRNQFMVFQLSGSLMMLLVTGYIVWGYQRSASVDPGFDGDNLFFLTVDPARDGYSTEASAELLAALPRRLEALPEVRSAALSLNLPFSQPVVIPNRAVTVDTESGEEDSASPRQAVRKVVRQRVGTGYFETLGVPILRGRGFSRRETSAQTDGDSIPVVLNSTAAERLFPGADPIGVSIREKTLQYVVIGIAKDTKSGMMMGAAVPTMFAPLTGESFGGGGLIGASILLRGMPGAAPLEAAKRELAGLEQDLTVFNARSFEEDMEQFNVFMRFASIMNGSLGVFGLILSVIGLFGITAHSVARRRKEIGIRVAVGARRTDILKLVLGEAFWLVIVGGALGFAGAYGLSRAFSATTSRLAEVFAIGTDAPFLVYGAPLAWAAMAMLACLWPARRSMRINPVSTLRTE